MVLDEILSPANTVNVLEKHLDLSADEQRLECGIVHIHVVNRDFLDRGVMGVDLGEQSINVRELTFDDVRPVLRELVLR